MFMFFEPGAFRPTQYSGLALWYDAADTTTITSVSNAASQMNDKSGNGLNATQGTGALQPGTGLTTINGRNVLDFNMDTMGFANVPGMGTAQTVFYMIAPNTTDTTGTFPAWFAINNVTTNGRLPLIYCAKATLTTSAIVHSWPSLDGLNFGTNDGFVSGSSVVGRTTAQASPAAATAKVSFSATTKSGIPVIVDSAGTGILGSSNTVMKFGELIVYNRVLSAGEIFRVLRYLSLKWGVTLL